MVGIDSDGVAATAVVHACGGGDEAQGLWVAGSTRPELRPQALLLSSQRCRLRMWIKRMVVSVAPFAST